MAYQIPGLLLLVSALVAAIVILVAPLAKLWTVTTVVAAAVTVGMVVSYISLSA